MERVGRENSKSNWRGNHTYTPKPAEIWARFIGPVRTVDGRLISTEFDEHFAVILKGRIYDRITGLKGLSLDEYRKLLDFSEELLFTP